MQQVLLWIVTGLVAGWLARITVKSRREFGLAGDLTLGTLGALIGEWLLRALGIPSAAAAVHVFFAVVGAVMLIGGLRLARQLFRATGLPPLAQTGGRSLDLDAQIRRLGDVERRVIAAFLGRKPTVQDPTHAFDQRMTFGQRVADRVAAFGGSWTFIGLFGSVILGWILLNDSLTQAFDPFPYILLNLILSCLAALQAPVIMMSQNRQSIHDRIEARNDYEVNLRAEMEIARLHAKLDGVREQEWAEFLLLQKEQVTMLRRIDARLTGANPDVTA